MGTSKDNLLEKIEKLEQELATAKKHYIVQMGNFICIIVDLKMRRNAL